MGERYTKSPSLEELVDIIADILMFVGKQKGSVAYINGKKIRNGLGIDAGPIVLTSIHYALKKLGFQTISAGSYKFIVIPTKNKLSQIGLTHGKDALKAELRKLLQ